MTCRALAVVAALAFTPVLAQEGGDPIAEVLARVRPSLREDAWRLIPWRTSLTGALAVAKAHDRPVFLFAYDGTLADGNC